MPLIQGAMALMGMVTGALGQLVQILLRPVVQHLNALDPDVALSPADAADGVERNRWTNEVGWDQARSWGVGQDVFNMMVDLIGEPPGIEQMLSLVRRGVLDTDTMAEMIAYSRIRTEWTDYVMALMYQPMSSADAIEAGLKGVLSLDDSTNAFVAGGGEAFQYQTLLDTAGDAIGVEQAANLYNHGLISEADFQAVILHSRINPTFEPMAELTRFHWIGAFQIMRMLTTGSVTAEEATTWLLEEGYPADQTAAFVGAGTSTKTAAHKEISESQVTQAYDAGIITSEQATYYLGLLGYTSDEVPFILSLYDYKRKLSMDTAAIGQVRKVFLAGRVDANTAGTMLDSLGVDPEAKSYYLAIWEVESQSELKEITVAQLGNAFKAGGLDYPSLIARYVAMGYSTEDAELIALYYGGDPIPGSPGAQAPTTGG